VQITKAAKVIVPNEELSDRLDKDKQGRVILDNERLG
jgi:hypothetical protein